MAATAVLNFNGTGAAVHIRNGH